MQSFTRIQHNKYLLVFAVVTLNFLASNVNSVRINFANLLKFIAIDFKCTKFHSHFCYQQVTLDEFKHTLKIVHDTCQTVTKVPEDLITQVRGDDFVENKDVKVSLLILIEWTFNQNCKMFAIVASATFIVQWKCFIYWMESRPNFMLPKNIPII